MLKLTARYSLPTMIKKYRAISGRMQTHSAAHNTTHHANIMQARITYILSAMTVLISHRLSPYIKTHFVGYIISRHCPPLPHTSHSPVYRPIYLYHLHGRIAEGEFRHLN